MKFVCVSVCVLNTTGTFGGFCTSFASQWPLALKQSINLWNSLESQLWYLSAVYWISTEVNSTSLPQSQQVCTAQPNADDIYHIKYKQQRQSNKKQMKKKAPTNKDIKSRILPFEYFRKHQPYCSTSAFFNVKGHTIWRSFRKITGISSSSIQIFQIFLNADTSHFLTLTAHLQHKVTCWKVWKVWTAPVDQNIHTLPQKDFMCENTFRGISIYGTFLPPRSTDQ